MSLLPLDELKVGDVVTGGEGDLARLRRPFSFLVTRVSRDGGPNPGDHVTVTGVIKRHRGHGRIICIYGWAGEPVAQLAPSSAEDEL